MPLQECDLLDFTRIKKSRANGLLVGITEKCCIREGLVFVLHNHLMLSRNKLLLLLLDHLCISLVAFQCIGPLLNQLTSLRLFGDQVSDLSEVVCELLVIVPLLLCLHVCHHSRLREDVLSLEPLRLLVPQLSHQLLLFLVELLVHLEVLLLLELQDVFHDLGDMPRLGDVLLPGIEVSLVLLSLVVLQLQLFVSLLL